MKVHLVSGNREVHKLCQEVLGEIIGRGWTLHVAGGCAAECDADLFVWDIESNPWPLPEIDFHAPWRHFFLVDRTDVEALRPRLPFPDANILLKPVTRAALAAFLSDTCKRALEAPLAAAAASSVESLKADRDKILQCLIQANLKLQEYDHDRTNFLARAIHDFRAPLTAITGYCGLLLGEDVGTLSSEQREVLDRMYHSARKLSRMASAMFQLSIAPRAEMTLDLKRGDIRECIEHALDEIVPAAEEKRISISVDVIPTEEPLFFEPNRLEQVLVNLLDNACKFTPRSGSIEIRAYPFFWDRRMSGRTGAGSGNDRRLHDENAPNAYRVDTRDNGPGIPSSRLAKVFEEYTSYGGGTDRSGGGLGLAVCRMILNQHRGAIWAESNGDGALFSFVLPFHRAEAALSGGSGQRRAQAGA